MMFPFSSFLCYRTFGSSRENSIVKLNERGSKYQYWN